MGNSYTSTAQDWESEAGNWIRWARTPDLDSYWRYRDGFFELVPEAGAATLDLGCGEGRVARDLAERGHRVTGIDASPRLVEAAAEAHPEGEYLVADSAGLPFEDESFDVVIAYNFLMDNDNLAATMREARRVLAPDGKLVISVIHPANTGKRTGEGEDLAFLVDKTYFEGYHHREKTERDGVPMTFSGYAHPLTRYTDEFEACGLGIEAVREPKAVLRDGTVSPLPWHLWLRVRRL